MHVWKKPVIMEESIGRSLWQALVPGDCCSSMTACCCFYMLIAGQDFFEEQEYNYG